MLSMGYLFVKHESHGSVLLLIYSIEKVHRRGWRVEELDETSPYPPYEGGILSMKYSFILNGEVLYTIIYV